jgi:PhnB protein
MPPRPIPDGYDHPIPFLAVDDAVQAIEFYARAFGARERMRMQTPDGRIAHAEIELAGYVVMLADPLPQYSWKPPQELGGTSVGIGLYVTDVDAAVRRALEAGATLTAPVEDKFYGDRYGTVRDSIWPRMAARHAQRRPHPGADRRAKQTPLTALPIRGSARSCRRWRGSRQLCGRPQRPRAGSG